MESIAHKRLKELAVGFLRSRGCQAFATEVRCPISRFRVDVAGYIDTFRRRGAGRHTRRRRCPPRTVIIECKQSRSDLLSDLAAADELLALRERLQRIRRSIEENRIKSEEPHLRRQGSMLFEDMCDWDFEQSRLPAYRRVVRQLSMLDRRLHGETKFHLMARYRLADRLYLAAPEGLVRRRDVPEGWGLIECPKGLLKKGGDQLTFDAPNPAIVRYTAPQLAASEERRMRLLRNIAVAACWAGTRKDGQLAQ